MRIVRLTWPFGLAASLVACDPSVSGPVDEKAGPDTVMVALDLLGSRTYLGFQGGLHAGGVNDPPQDHAASGLAAAKQIRPLAAAGTPDPNGRIVLLSIGMSNTTQEFCQPAGQTQQCRAWTFGGQASVDPAVNHGSVAIVDGAAGGQSASTWEDPGGSNYDRIRDQRLAPRGLSERQVQAVWLKVANPRPTQSLPGPRADAEVLVAQMGRIARALRARYPNLRQVFVSSRIWAGYATSTLNPEPFAYESGFAVKWLIDAQIEQARRGVIVDARAGDVRYPGVSPWLAWGPYLWAAGPTANGDGLAWQPADFADDGTHPSQAGQAKVGAMLLAFFKTSPFTRCWFVAGRTC